jgi:hypothetical protein
MGIRTPGLVIANDALYQLSYTPSEGAEIITRTRFFIKDCCFKQIQRSEII